MSSIGFNELLILWPVALVTVIPFWKIFTKAGFSDWMSLTQIVPVVLFYLAFAEWPIHRELGSLRPSSPAA